MVVKGSFDELDRMHHPWKGFLGIEQKRLFITPEHLYNKEGPA